VFLVHAPNVMRVNLCAELDGPNPDPIPKPTFKPKPKAQPYKALTCHIKSFCRASGSV